MSKNFWLLLLKVYTSFFIIIILVYIIDGVSDGHFFGRTIYSDSSRIATQTVLISLILVSILLAIDSYSVYLKNNKNNKNEFSAQKTNEFISILIPEGLKDLLIDSLRAFENYSKLSGYEVKFSFNNSEKDKLAFSFTVTENPNGISEDKIRADIKDFLKKVQNGEKFDDLPVSINPLEHQMVLTTLKNRASFIEHSYNIEKNMRELYEKTVKDLLTTKNLFTQQQQPMTVNNNYLQSGGQNNSKQIEATNSNVNMGDGNFVEDNSINIEHSFNEKKTIVEKIECSIRQIDKEPSLSVQDKQDLKRHLENIKEEITDEAKPDASKLKKSWDKIKKVAENLVLSKELTDSLEWISGMFNF